MTDSPPAASGASPASAPGHPHVRFERREGRYVVVKTGRRVDLRREARALTGLGSTAVELIDIVEIDATAAELITGRVLPGDDLRPLARVDDDTATRIVAELITAMRIGQNAEADATSPLPRLDGVLEPLRRCRDPRLPAALRDAALRLGEELVSSPDECVLHGDLQHRNIARQVHGDAHQWKVIDPHGWLGDACFETVAVLVAPESLLLGSDVIDARGMSGAPLVRRTRRRIDIIAEVTGDDRDRVFAWALAGAVIAEARMLDEYDLVHGAPLALAQTLARRPH